MVRRDFIQCFNASIPLNMTACCHYSDKVGKSLREFVVSYMQFCCSIDVLKIVKYY